MACLAFFSPAERAGAASGVLPRFGGFGSGSRCETDYLLLRFPLPAFCGRLFDSALSTEAAALDSGRRENAAALAQAQSQAASHVESAARLRGLPLFSECAVPPPLSSMNRPSVLLKVTLSPILLSRAIRTLATLGSPKSGKGGGTCKEKGEGGEEDVRGKTLSSFTREVLSFLALNSASEGREPYKWGSIRVARNLIHLHTDCDPRRVYV